LLLGRDRVDVARLGERREPDVQLAGSLEQLVEDEPGAFGAAGAHESVEGIHPLLRLRRVDVGKLVLELVEDVVDRFGLQRAPSGQWYGARRARLRGMENDPRRRRSRGGRRRGGGAERGRPTRTPAEPKAAPPPRGPAP